MKVSVIIPVTRAAEAQRSVESVMAQQTRHEVELLTVGADRSATVTVGELNPAVRRNQAAARAGGEILAFLDDDAFAAPDWVETAVAHLDSSPDIVALGGPDPAPPDAPESELMSETLLATRWIGSGILCHEGRKGVRAVRRPHDLALVNLFVRKSAFEEVGGFDESIGYIGEDTALINKLMAIGQVFYHSGVVVHHRRRSFPAPFFRQRWRYRRKTGQMLAAGDLIYIRNPRIWFFLTLPLVFLGLLIAAPALAVVLLIFYASLCLALGVQATRLPVHWWPLFPFAFAVHHGVYLLGTLSGLFGGLISRRNPAKSTL